MGKTYNKVILIGYVGADPEVKYYDSTSLRARFSLATNERGYLNKDNERVDPQTDWHPISAFGAKAKFVESYVKTGQLLLVEGKLHYQNTPSSKGEISKAPMIVASTIEILGDKSATAKAEEAFVEEKEPEPIPWDKMIETMESDVNDLPF
ncbi:MAG: single-stranded DNA-binding protein [Porphyromonas sp.]|nr:single-stranded DNA-binding protein [Porphyromonas sp.]